MKNQMTSKTTVIYHSADFDGLFSREIARKFLGESAEYIGWNFGDKPLEIPSEGLIYVIDLPVDRVFGGTFVGGVRCDWPENAPMNLKNDFVGMTLHRLVWIDHHKSSIETHPSTLNGYRIDGVAACRLAYQFFLQGQASDSNSFKLPSKEEFTCRKVAEPLAVRLAGEYDIWDRSDTRAELFQHGLRSREIDSRWWCQLLKTSIDGGNEYVDELLESGKVIQYVRDQEYSQVIKEQGFTFDWEGLTFLGCNSHRLDIRSHLFAAGLRPEHQALFGFTYVGGKWSVSMYHAPGHEHHDLSIIAKKYNGGGHRGACGMILDKLPFLALTT